MLVLRIAPFCLAVSLSLSLGVPSTAHAEDPAEVAGRQDGDTADGDTANSDTANTDTGNTDIGNGAVAEAELSTKVETSAAWEAFSRELARRLEAAGRIPDAVEEHIAVAVLDPDNLDVPADAALLLLDQATQIAHGLDPGSPYLLTIEHLVSIAVSRGGVGDGRLAFVIGRLRLLDGKYIQAYEMLNEARTAGFDIERLRPWLYLAAVNRAPILLGEGKADLVIAELQALIAEQPEHPNSVDAQINLAAAYRRNQERVRSQEILEALAKSHPQDHRPWAGLGREHFDQGRLEESLQAYRKALALSGGNRDAYSQSLASIALVLYKLGRLDESERAAKGFMELDSSSSAALHLLAMLRRKRGETLEALRLLRRADRLSPDDPAILTLMEQIHYERGEIEEAQAIQKRRDANYHEPGKESERDGETGADAEPPREAPAE